MIQALKEMERKINSLFEGFTEKEKSVLLWFIEKEYTTSICFSNGTKRTTSIRFNNRFNYYCHIVFENDDTITIIVNDRNEERFYVQDYNDVSDLDKLELEGWTDRTASFKMDGKFKEKSLEVDNDKPNDENIISWLESNKSEGRDCPPGLEEMESSDTKFLTYEYQSHAYGFHCLTNSGKENEVYTKGTMIFVDENVTVWCKSITKHFDKIKTTFRRMKLRISELQSTLESFDWESSEDYIFFSVIEP